MLINQQVNQLINFNHGSLYFCFGLYSLILYSYNFYPFFVEYNISFHILKCKKFEALKLWLKMDGFHMPFSK